ncbi:DUF4232 domain-containing protein [Streptomyces sp. NPDC093109]|uniref:DUF4232 domain-containing protein n=1 Tax=Streptomyces sp. NPDC093109 TaxID=3154977 RepID=UPI00344CE6B3
MRVHKLTFAALAVAASLSLTACQDEDVTGQGDTPSASVSAPSTDSTPSPSGSTPDSSSTPDSGSSDNAAGTGSSGQGTGTGSSTGGSSSGGSSTGGSGTGGSGSGGGTANCRTDNLSITADDVSIGGDPYGTVAVTLKNRGGQDCQLAAFAGVDLKTNSGTLSAKRAGQGQPSTLKAGAEIYFPINYPLNETGGSGVRITGLVVTPPNETKSVTLNWPGAASLPVTEGGGSSVEVGSMGSVGQGG